MNKKITENKKIVLWEGLKKEIPWILFWILVGITVYGYYQDKQICEEVLADPCKICYNLNQEEIIIGNQTSIESKDYVVDPQSIYINISINQSLASLEDKNPNHRTLIS